MAQAQPLPAAALSVLLPRFGKRCCFSKLPAVPEHLSGARPRRAGGGLQVRHRWCHEAPACQASRERRGCEPTHAPEGGGALGTLRLGRPELLCSCGDPGGLPAGGGLVLRLDSIGVAVCTPHGKAWSLCGQ